MAKIERVTFTDVDDATEINRLNWLSEQFPFVEWGILISLSKGGQESRYPSLDQILRLGSAIRGNIALHLCGQWARLAASQPAELFGMAKVLVPRVGRVQLNICDMLEDVNWQRLMAAATQFELKVIVQTRNFEPTPIMVSHERDIQFLCDNSGGRGLYSPFAAPPKHLQNYVDWLGFAGGIGPDNAQDVVMEINALDIPNPTWIDMEGKVRTEDRFDLDKVEAVLSAIA